MSSKPPVFVTATLQAAVIAGMSNILAQTMTAYQENVRISGQGMWLAQL